MNALVRSIGSGRPGVGSDPQTSIASWGSTATGAYYPMQQDGFTSTGSATSQVSDQATQSTKDAQSDRSDTLDTLASPSLPDNPPCTSNSTSPAPVSVREETLLITSQPVTSPVLAVSLSPRPVALASGPAPRSSPAALHASNSGQHLPPVTPRLGDSPQRALPSGQPLSAPARQSDPISSPWPLVPQRSTLPGRGSTSPGLRNRVAQPGAPAPGCLPTSDAPE